MKLQFKYRGRSYSSGKALAKAMERDFNQQIERKIRTAASSSGLRARKTHQGIELVGEAEKLNKFYRRLGR